MFYYQRQQRPQKYSSILFHEQLKKLFENNAYLVKNFLEHYEKDLVRTQSIGAQLYENSKEIGILIGHFYGESDTLSNNFISFIKFISEAIDVIKWRKPVFDLRKRWNENADGITMIMHSYHPEWNIRNYFYSQILLIESMVTTHIKNKEGMLEYYNKLMDNNRKMATVISNGIVNQNSNKFV